MAAPTPRGHYVNDYDEVHARATLIVCPEPRSGRVTYHGDNGARFRVIVTQRPNQVGFRATLPGDKRKP